MRIFLHSGFCCYLLLCNIQTLSGQWTQIGADINGKTDGDKLGYAVSYSSDGTKIAVGAPNSAGGGIHRGHVAIYQNTDNKWVQLGQNLEGESDFDQFGWSVSLSSDGTKVAISSIFNQDNSGRGHVRIFQLKDTIWKQLGEDIEGEQDGDNSGASIALSADGRRVAIGANKNAGGGLQRGHARVFQYDGKDWTQLGDNLKGEADNDNFGSAVSLSADGSKMAVGSINNDGGGTLRGHVRVFQYNGEGWLQIGEDIDGEMDNDNSGYAVSLSLDGTKIAIGATGNDGGGYNSGHVRVYQLKNKTWAQLGGDMDGEAEMNQSGGAVSLSADGTKIAVGARLNAGGGYRRGNVRVFQLKDAAWSQLDKAINGEADSDLFGYSVSLSADGANLVIGAPSNGGEEGTQRGHVRVFQSALPPSVKEVVQTKIKEETTPNSVTTHTKIQPNKTTPSPKTNTDLSKSENTSDNDSQPFFKVFTEGGKNKLDWTAKIELATKGFYVERKKDDEWESLGYLTAYFNVNNYQFEDNLPAETINTYRVKTVNKDGKIVYSNVVSIDNNWKLKDIKLYPNQTKGLVNIDNGGQVIHSIVIVNPMGQVVLTKIKGTGADIQNIDIQGLSNGVYLVHIMSGRKIVTQKLMKQ